jgi:hypothetical protein
MYELQEHRALVHGLTAVTACHNGDRPTALSAVNGRRLRVYKNSVS